MDRYIKGYTGYFRNNSTGNPTKVHLIDPDTGNTFCGFRDDWCAEYHPYEIFVALRDDCCKHCLKKAKPRDENGKELDND